MVSAVVPARDEADRVGRTVRALRRIPGVGEVVVVDDGSWDGTARMARRAGARVVRLSRGRGKAWALYLGLRAARGPVLLMADADLGDSAGHLGVLCRLVEQGWADLAVGVPAVRVREGLGIVQAVARWGTARLGGVGLAAPLSGQRALRAEAAPLLVSGKAVGYGVETEINVRAGRRGLRVVERPVPIRHRPLGRSLAGWLHRARQLRDVLVTLGRLAAGG